MYLKLLERKSIPIALNDLSKESIVFMDKR